MRIFETHAHLDFQQFNKDRDDIIRRCFRDGIEYIINVGVDKKSIEIPLGTDISELPGWLEKQGVKL